MVSKQLMWPPCLLFTVLYQLMMLMPPVGSSTGRDPSPETKIIHRHVLMSSSEKSAGSPLEELKAYTRRDNIQNDPEKFKTKDMFRREICHLWELL